LVTKERARTAECEYDLPACGGRDSDLDAPALDDEYPICDISTGEKNVASVGCLPTGDRLQVLTIARGQECEELSRGFHTAGR
jgi:hypothetical protein